MKKIIHFLALAFVFSNVLFFTSCEEDGTGGGPTGTDPSVTLTGIPFDDQAPGASMTVNLSVTKGDDNLSSVEIKLDGVRLATGSITSLEGIGTPNNPFIIPDAGYTGDVTIVLPDTEGSYSYSFTATASGGSTGSDQFTVVVAKAKPTISVFGAPDTDVTAGSDFTVTADAIVGEAQLRTLTITENGDNLPVSRLVIAGLSSFTNPYELEGADKDGANYDVTVTTPSNPGTYDYVFRMEDEDGEFDEDFFSVTVVGTAITETLTAELLSNQAGDVGKGALDLDEGLEAGVTSTGETTPDQAEIRDMGLDCTIPAPGFNWRRQIATVNGAELREVDLSVVEGFTFDGVGTVEQIVAAYDSGFTFADGEATNCGNGNTTPATNVSDPLEVGGLFVVRGSNGVYYLIKVDEVNETGDDNDDYYSLSIKY